MAPPAPAARLLLRWQQLYGLCVIREQLRLFAALAPYEQVHVLLCLFVVQQLRQLQHLQHICFCDGSSCMDCVLQGSSCTCLPCLAPMSRYMVCSASLSCNSCGNSNTCSRVSYSVQCILYNALRTCCSASYPELLYCTMLYAHVQLVCCITKYSAVAPGCRNQHGFGVRDLTMTGTGRGVPVTHLAFATAQGAQVSNQSNQSHNNEVQCTTCSEHCEGRMGGTRTRDFDKLSAVKINLLLADCAQHVLQRQQDGQAR